MFLSLFKSIFFTDNRKRDLLMYPKALLLFVLMKYNVLAAEIRQCYLNNF